MKFLLQHKLYSRSLLGKCDVPVLFYSIQPSVKKLSNESPSQTGESKAGTKGAPLKVKPKREPFLKNILQGKFDIEMLTYPEVLDKQRLKNINKMSRAVENSILEDKNVQNLSGLFSKHIAEITSLGLSKQKIPFSYNGFEYSASESARIMEVLGRNSELHSYFSNQNIVQEVIALSNNVLKEKYLRNIAENDLKGTVCLNESLSEFDSLRSKTSVTSDQVGQNLLNGQKIWVSHADIADIFVVTGQHNGPAVFIVDKNKPGITVTKNKENGYFTVTFKNTPIDESEIITSEGGALETLYKIQNLGMFYYASAVLGMVKDIFQQTTQLAIFRPVLEKQCSDFEPTKLTLSKLASEIYALESMLYSTANLIDGYEHQDYEVEIAVLKLFASRVSNKLITECIDLLGPHATDATMRSYQYPFLQSLCTLRRLSHLHFSDDLVNLYIAIKCIEHNKLDLCEYIKKIRNPFTYVNESFKHTFYQFKNDRDKPKLDLHLHWNLHPTLKVSSDSLEYCVKRLEYANITLLDVHGADTYEHHYSLHRMTNIITDIYAMTSVLSRASYSCAKNIQDSELEIELANNFCQGALRNVKMNVSGILNGPYNESDFEAKRLSKKIVSSKGYFVEHPLARNIV